MTRYLILTLLLATLVPIQAKAAGPVKICFVDTGNTGRSVTAQALANALTQKQKLQIQVISRAVDLNPYDTVPEPPAAELLARKGLDVSAHRATQLTDNDIRHSDLIQTMTEKHGDTILAPFPGATSTRQEIMDAWRQPKAVYEKAFEQIDHMVPLALANAAKQ